MVIILHCHAFPADAKGKAVFLKIKQDGVLAGLDVAREIFFVKNHFQFLQHLKKMVMK